MKEIPSDREKVSSVVCRSPRGKKEGSWLGLYISLMSALSPLPVHQEENCHMWLLASYTFLKAKSKVVFLMPEIVLITSCSHVLIRLYKGLGQSTLEEAWVPALVPNDSNAPATVSLSGKLGFVAIKLKPWNQIILGGDTMLLFGVTLSLWKSKIWNLKKYRGNQSLEKFLDFLQFCSCWVEFSSETFTMARK